MCTIAKDRSNVIKNRNCFILLSPLLFSDVSLAQLGSLSTTGLLRGSGSLHIFRFLYFIGSLKIYGALSTLGLL